MLFSSDKLLIRETQELSENLPSTLNTVFPDPNNLAEFYLIGNVLEVIVIFSYNTLLFCDFLVSPNEGLWRDGKFKFSIKVTEEYNMTPPIVKCLTKILHPNISCKFQDIQL